ncbi:MAG: Nif3-like dinuclear metal center hexameric protein [Thermoanaerobaculia bacterium]
MVARDELVAYLDHYLSASAGADMGPNGLQVEGAGEIRKIVSGVSACHELFVEAARRGAQAVLVHHGIFWDGMPRQLVGWRFRRVEALLRADLNLLAYHLPLDRHPEVGNNAVAARRLGLADVEPFGEYQGLPVGLRGRFPEPLPAGELIARAEALYGQRPLAFAHGPDPMTTLGIISGGAQREIHQAIAAGLDAYITGEASEWVMNIAREARIHFLACGHYATERLGVLALGDHLADRFGLEVEFVDIPNPV